MFPAALQLDPIQLAALVPPCYAEFRPVVAEGLGYFALNLPPHRVADLLAEQAALPDDADLLARLAPLLHGSPALHKVGQVLARRRELDPALRRRLQRLESMEPRTPLPPLLALVRRELGPLMRTYRIALGPAALAEASVAVVLPVTWTDPSTRQRHDGVLKLLKPGVLDCLGEDLNALAHLADFLGDRAADLHLPPLAYRDIFDEVRDLLENEVRLDQEQAHLRRAAEQYACDADVLVPAPLPFSTSRVTAMERVRGKKVTSIRAVNGHGAAPPLGPRLFQTIARALLADVALTRDESRLFHGDPHAGNLFVTDAGRLAVLDWSLAGTLRNTQREQLAQIVLASVRRDEPAALKAVEALASVPPNAQTTQRIVHRALTGSRAAAFPGPESLMLLLDDLARAGVRFPPNLMLFRKSFFTLEGVLGDVSPGRSIEDALIAEVVRRFAAEWPARWLRPPTSRAFDTQVSLTDLLGLALFLPITPPRPPP